MVGDSLALRKYDGGMASDERATRIRRSRFPLAQVAAVITISSWVIQGVQRSAPSGVPQTPPPVPVALPSEAVPIWSSDVTQNVGPPPSGGRVVTGKLLDGQKAARGGTCGHEDQVAIGRGCWMVMKKQPKPPPIRCGDLFEYNGECYIPVKAEPKLPTSIHE